MFFSSFAKVTSAESRISIKFLLDLDKWYKSAKFTIAFSQFLSKISPVCVFGGKMICVIEFEWFHVDLLTVNKTITWLEMEESQPLTIEDLSRSTLHKTRFVAIQ